MLTQILTEYIQPILSQYKGLEVIIANTQTVSGGDINDAFKLDTNAGSFFIKINSASKFPGMFQQEAIGLGALVLTNTLKTPRVIAHSEELENAFLLLEWEEKGSPKSTFWDDFGRELAQMHQTSNNQFGWAQNNYIGSLIQHNEWQPSWSEFFILQRLEPQLKLALEKGRMNAHHVKTFELLFHRLEHLFSAEKPALLHGDLWSGNFMVADDGEPIIIDPAVYYGNREMDLAMTKLFGGFDPQLYKSYHEAYPLENGWEERVDLCNLYPLLVHVNLFGGGYVRQLDNILSRFI